MNTKTLMYILKRIGLALLTVWIVVTVTFFVMHAVPGGPSGAVRRHRTQKTHQIAAFGGWNAGDGVPYGCLS